MKVVAVIQARMGSSRLPGKSLLALAGRPMIEHVVERVRAMTTIDEVVLATTWNESDEPLVTLAHRLGALAFRGPEANVLRRVCDAAAWRQADAIVRVTADCPFWDPAIGDSVVRYYQALVGRIDYASNDTLSSGYPDGTDTEVFSRAAIETADVVAHVSEREHVTTWIRKYHRCATLMSVAQPSVNVKLSVDTREDYDRAAEIARLLPRGDYALATTLRAAGVEWI